jgi:hypothetical protein
MFKNREILSEIVYVKEICDKLDLALKMIVKCDSKVELKIDDIKKTLSCGILESEKIENCLEDIKKSIEVLNDSIKECKSKMTKEKNNKTLQKKKKSTKHSKNE